MERRGFLAATGTALLGGCSANSPGSDEQPRMSDAQGPTRGESDVEIEVREIEDDEDVEYIDEDHSVRYVAGWRHTNHEEVQEGEPPEREPFYDTTPFERWGETQCLTAAARAAAEHVNDELDTDEVSSGITSLVDGEDRAAIVTVQTILDRGGEPVHETSVEFDALVATTPATVGVTYRLDDQEYQVDAPVYARYDVLQQD